MQTSEDRIYLGKTKRLLIEQPIGDKIWEELGEKYEVKRLVGNGEEIILIEEKHESK